LKRKKQGKKCCAGFVKKPARHKFVRTKIFFENSSDQKLQKVSIETYIFYFIAIKNTFLCQIDNFYISMSNCGFLKKTSKHWGFYSHFEFFFFFFSQVEKKHRKSTLIFLFVGFSPKSF